MNMIVIDDNTLMTKVTWKTWYKTKDKEDIEVWTIDNKAWTRLDKENDMANIEDIHDDNDKQAWQDDMASMEKLMTLVFGTHTHTMVCYCMDEHLCILKNVLESFMCYEH